MTTITKSGTNQKQRLASTRKRPERFVSQDSMFTVEQWAAMPDTRPRYELVDGKLIQKMTTNTAHAWAAGKLLIALSQWGDTHGWTFLPEGTGVKLGEYGGAVPDVVGFSPNQQLRAEANYYEQPFLVAEILSKRTAKRDRTRKVSGYAAIGVQLYLIIDPVARTMEVHTLQNGVYAAPQVFKDNDVWQPAELPGVTVELQKLWFA
jgi:Uma2 family endonuclease